MVKEYAERLYEPAASAAAELAANGCKKAMELSKWKDSIRKSWPQIRVQEAHTDAQQKDVAVGEEITVTATIHLDGVKPEEVRVQAYYGEAVNNVITKPVTSELAKVKKLDHGNYLFEGKVPAMESGTYGLNVRVIPTHPHLIQAHELRLITWAR
jgi:starch phosphorylase